MSFYRRKTLVARSRSLAVLAVVAVIAVSLAGCSDDHRRLSEKEALDYKRDLIRQGELSASQVTEFGSDTRRTKVEIDSLYSRLNSDSTEQRAKERAYWEDELRRERETSPESVEP